MTIQPGDNSASTPRPVDTSSREEWEYFDRLPKEIQHALREAPFDYNAKMVFEAYQQVKADSVNSFVDFFNNRPQQSPIFQMLWMIQQNINNDLVEYRASLRTVPRKH